ncbi:RNA:NAD 2'-phosphotransferase [Bernardetia litoralis DSM 6794]|uniref:Probable RNA 2'-phosphotransferase n=1 Tax=Bernardetia litoralis (strain ATCC 23117 / DSM 6794 / NBRC 15988 / NCIMB 1366 / Fx l1 / Sio-4) TaxID=880071 RepID=I4ANZ4_BERLS|nr:RNA 2'-phosphotransferase [Bernardetia litoralis]AFM05679.1 RNA:NAD 2'-phosphotransferase [Bernardetia litoralis DSM 6794]
MDAKKIRKRSKFLSLVLRHQPDLINIKLEKEGWTDSSILLEKINDYRKGEQFTFQELEYIVENNDKKRFGFNADKTKIRANQGHSANVEMNYQPITPPSVLYHGTATKNIKSILENGILKRNRQYVHLSADLETAQKVGARHGKSYIFKIETFKMKEAGIKFYCSENGVWLTDFISKKYLNEK